MVESNSVTIVDKMSTPTDSIIKLKALHYHDGDTDNYYYIKTVLSKKELDKIVKVMKIIRDHELNNNIKCASDSEIIRELARGESEYKDEQWLKPHLKGLAIDPNYEDETDGVKVETVEY